MAIKNNKNKERIRFSSKLIARILKRQDAVRVSREAKKELSIRLEELANQIARLAIRNALHLGRKTITREDIKFALKEIGLECEWETPHYS